MSYTSTMLLNTTDSTQSGRIVNLKGLAPPRLSSLRSEPRFGRYVLGQTLGEGEFGKVKLGWLSDDNIQKRDVQVAIKLIRRESITASKSRLNKIEREINVLKRVQHPNIVQCYEVVETDKYIGIILEYASGGELFDFILAHRYLKDQIASRLFAQLISAVSYLHEHGVVHRDLKLENLLLDRNHNIIVTDFGFANTFPLEPLTTDESGVDLISTEHISGQAFDMMQTSCGSPCYAAPELVVSDGAYCGRKVDVWSCGVILYAMLAGYLPFDDDPDNPEGDNISLLYKYIMTTSLTFPEYVTPLARDLLRRMLVPDPRRRSTLLSIMDHPWLAIQSLELKRKLHYDMVKISSNRSGAQEMLRSVSEHSPCHKNPTLPANMTRTRDSSLHPDSASRTNKRNTIHLGITQGIDASLKVKGQLRTSSLEEDVTSLAIKDTSQSGSLSLERSACVKTNSPSASRTGDSISNQIVKATKPSLKLPAPSRKPRPTSYHPGMQSERFTQSYMSAPSVELSKSTFSPNPDSNVSSFSGRNEALHHPRLSSFKTSRTASPRSTAQNAAGELSIPGPDTRHEPGRDTHSEDRSNAINRRSHKKTVSSISSLAAVFSKLHMNSNLQSKSDHSPDAVVYRRSEQVVANNDEMNRILSATNAATTSTEAGPNRKHDDINASKSKSKFRASAYLPRSFTAQRLPSLSKPPDSAELETLPHNSGNGLVHTARRFLNIFSRRRTSHST